jgi:hypothetical protein
MTGERIGNTNVTWEGTPSGYTTACDGLLFGLQRKSPGRDFVRILQREKKFWRPGSALSRLSESHFSGMKPPKMFLPMSKSTVSVFGCQSQRL